MIHVAYFTDPLCPWSWGAEPQVRRLEVEFSGQVQITYVMVGIAREVDAPEKLAATLDVIAETHQPADPRIWLEHPPRSTYPACLAVKAASEQNADGAFLRRLREGAFLRRERIDNAEAFLAAGRDTPGLDLDRFDIDMRSNAIVELFGADRERAQGACGDERPALPAFSVDGGEPVGAAEVRAAVLAAGGSAGALPAPLEALARLGTATTAELAAAAGLPLARARVELWRAASEFAVRPVEFAFGELWASA